MLRSTNTALAGLKPSGIRRINALARQTPGCIALALGEPEFDTPAEICAAAKAAIDRGETHYPANNGKESLRMAIAEYMTAQGIEAKAEDIIVTDGATEALHATLMALLNPGDEVIIPTPAFGLYESIVVANHAKPVFLDTSKDDFQLGGAALRAAVTDATKAIVICSPNNPTGCILAPESLDALARVAAETGVYVICDDVYNRLVYSESYERFAVRHPELAEQTIVVDSYSKPWAMTGWRLGWLRASGPVAAEVAKAHQYLVSSVPAFLMDAATVALGVDPSEMRETYRSRRSKVVAALEAMGLPTVEPEGAFYAFPSVEPTGLSDEEFCIRAIEEAGVALVPGEVFGCPGNVRLSYCIADKDLEEALNRLKGFVGKLAH